MLELPPPLFPTPDSLKTHIVGTLQGLNLGVAVQQLRVGVHESCLELLDLVLGCVEILLCLDLGEADNSRKV